jgi:large subunit ribosomal protein L10
MKKQEKSFFVQNLAEELKLANAVILVDYTGLTVKAQQELKKKLKKVNTRMIVVKNTLFKLAGQSINSNKEILSDTVLEGPTALVISEDDAIAPLQVLAKFAKEYEVPQLKVGLIEGAFQNKEELTKLSTLPGKDVLIGQVLGSVAAPMHGLVSTLQGNMQKLVFILDEYSKSEARNPKS